MEVTKVTDVKFIPAKLTNAAIVGFAAVQFDNAIWFKDMAVKINQAGAPAVHFPMKKSSVTGKLFPYYQFSDSLRAEIVDAVIEQYELWRNKQC